MAEEKKNNNAEKWKKIEEETKETSQTKRTQTA